MKIDDLRNQLEEAEDIIRDIELIDEMVSDPQSVSLSFPSVSWSGDRTLNSFSGAAEDAEYVEILQEMLRKLKTAKLNRLAELGVELWNY